MISHALTIITNELNKHLSDNYGQQEQVKLGNLAEVLSGGGNVSDASRNMLCFSIVNIQEEKTLKNLPHRASNIASLKANYENPPIFLNLLTLITAAHNDYTNGLLMLSRAIRFFQLSNVFTEESVAHASLTEGAPTNALDQLKSFKLIFDLYSPTMEEVNHLWGTLGGKQYPFVLYMVRMLDLKFKAVQEGGGLITEIISSFSLKDN